jgi:hypothetical protein
MRHFEDVQQAPLDDGKTPHLCQRPWASQRRNHTIRAPGLSVAGEAGMKGLPAAVLFWIGALGTFRGVEVRGQGLPDGSACSLDSDCASFRCDVGQCAEPNCQDLVRNGFETGVGEQSETPNRGQWRWTEGRFGVDNVYTVIRACACYCV